jgi:hypothetical protein
VGGEVTHQEAIACRTAEHLPDKAFEGFDGQDDTVYTVAETLTAASHGLQPHNPGGDTREGAPGMNNRLPV